ncbi:MAG: hypothetical protein ACOYVD_02700 [Bacillota bacterium]
MNWETFIVNLILGLIPVITSIAAYVLIKAARFLIQHTDNLVVKAALENLEKIVFSTVTSLGQTIVDDLKRSKIDGKLTKEEADLIKNKAFSSIEKQLSEQQKEILSKQLGSIDEFIDNLIEQKVMENKLMKGSNSIKSV